ncbi:aminotransferase class I/II-fold pyridoxal phosphate-dependent enzyme [Halarcobacter ebronensis]|uniref:8-amino-7-oxononanoate synthase n=1 Tax=Halarcobacter ebronensis TaxID=1462615 RepID=A0A4Q1AWW8_9BACT|nr:pyridoxal phosphate-dependent aminotransferase family protein [Halarcobacter ebronensis]QKF83137.1 8-amino-7-oxononanoate synthase [Halarcobacter ebronensis]RXK05225.1 8-amino-7-oxononanoate synthase [Halarcobacter ebronensis]
MYSKELNSIKKSNRFRTRELYDENLIDLASNDYLGLTANKELFQNAYQRVLKNSYTAPKASMLVNGYSTIHKEFEDALKEANSFEDALIVGSGFLANLSMIEALVRKGDTLFIDEEYHASGMVATRLLSKNQVVIFKHNDTKDLLEKISNIKTKGRKIIAIEGVYSMGGDLASKEIFDIANEYDALLIVDEAHSSGVIGENLLGIFDYYGITPKENHIKMGTLGKAYGSYGAYILASSNIIAFLLNRAKAVIYTTAPSLFDTALGLESLKFIQKNKKLIKNRITSNLKVIKESLGITSNSLIIPIEIGDNKKVITIQQKLKKDGYLVGAIRQPTVKNAIIRLIAKIDISAEQLEKVCKKLEELR